MTYQAAIFDMDGLLLDTERLYIELCSQLARDRGYEIPKAAFLEAIGRDDRDACRIFHRHLGEDFPIEVIRSHMPEAIQRYVETKGAPIKLYATEILTQLHEAGIPIAIATSTAQDNARFRIQSAGWEALFETFAFGNEVQEGKPAPYIFLLAAQRLGADPSKCVVLEDSPYGIRAAHRAGMTPIWVPDLLTPEGFPEEAAMAHCIVPSLKEACEMILS